MFIGLLIVAIIAGILLVLIILAQNPKGGINNQLGAGSNVLGVKKTTDFLEKATWVLAVTVIITSVAATKFHADSLAVGGNSTVKDLLNDGNSQTIDLEEGADGNEDFNFDDPEKTESKDSSSN